MYQRVAYILLGFLLLTTGSLHVAAQKKTERRALRSQQPVSPDSIQKLTKEMYRYYTTQDTAAFMAVSEKLKQAALVNGDDRTFYTAWGNQAMYTFIRINQKKGIERGQEVHQYAQKHDNKFGLYTATFILGTIRSSAKNNELAEKSFLEAIELHKKYFPGKSAAAAYLGLCKVEYNRHRITKVLEYSQNALNEPGVIPIHQITAWTYKCLAKYSFKDSIGFEEAYKERKQLMEKHKQGGAFGELIELYKALNRKQWDLARQMAERQTPQTRASHLSSIYEQAGDYQKALYWQKTYKKIGDSIYSAEVRSKISEFDHELALAKAEKESKDLQLANQQLKLAHISDELRHKALEAEKAELGLKNADIELANAAIRLKNDSLERSEQAAKLSEMQSKVEAQQNAERNRRILTIMGVAIALLTITYLVFYLYRRQKQMKRLESMNHQLQTAYDQLEEATTARERIESELRIARNIQMGMVPHIFPTRPDLDMYAMMTPAKEVGGDLYNYVLLDDQLYFCVGDVSGKGVPASLFMAEVSRMFRTLVDGHLKPHIIATRLNKAMSENNEQGMFVTMFIGLIDLKTGHMDFCNAGHNPPLLDGVFMEIEPNAPIGLWENLDFTGEEVSDLRGKTLFIYTDGLNEAENIEQEQFGDDRLQELLTHDYGTAQQTSEAVHRTIEDFVGEANPSDDMTKMCIKVLKPTNEAQS